MAQQHVNLLGDLAAALLEVPEGDRVSIFLWPNNVSVCMNGNRPHACGETAAETVRLAIALADPADWFAEAYMQACA